MIELLKLLNTSMATFGNHEFESFRGTTKTKPPPYPLFEMIEQSTFPWVSSNFKFDNHQKASHLRASGKLISYFPIRLNERHEIDVLGLLYEADDPDEFHGYGKTLNPTATATKLIAKLDSTCPSNVSRLYVALTHQYLDDDKRFAKEIKKIPLIMGGHDHSVLYHETEPDSLIVKAMSDGRTIRLNWLVLLDESYDALIRDVRSGDDRARRELNRQMMMGVCLPVFHQIVLGSWQRKGKDISETEQAALKELLRLPVIDQRHPTRGIPEPPKSAVRKIPGGHLVIFSLAVNLINKGLLKLVPPDKVVEDFIASKVPSSSSTPSLFVAPDDLEIDDKTVRRRSTNFGNLVADFMRGLYEKHKPDRLCEISVINSGSFRIDRNIVRGERITGNTLCEIFFHANDVRRFSLSGKTIVELLETSLQLRNKNAEEGHGQFLQISGLSIIVGKDGTISVNLKGTDEPIEPDGVYSLATTSYVAKRSSEFKHFFKGRDKGSLEADIESGFARFLTALSAQKKKKGWVQKWNDICEHRWIWSSQH